MVRDGAAPSDAATSFFEGHPLGLWAYRWCRSIVEAIGPFSVRVTKSQLGFRRRRGFAWLWLPDRWLSKPDAEVVLSIALDRPDPSPRFKQVAQPAPGVWMHHLEVRSAADLDADVAAWLREAYERRG
jgi:hypothetical protein